MPDQDEMRRDIALACRVLAARGLSDGVLGHISLRVGQVIC
jgi:ribulose-5-phosphate 4-epimerase/fuculose-1-phosphate aldolase